MARWLPQFTDPDAAGSVDAARRRRRTFLWPNLRSGFRLRYRHGAAFAFPDFQLLFLQVIFLPFIHEVEEVAGAAGEAAERGEGQDRFHGPRVVRKLRAVITHPLVTLSQRCPIFYS